MSKLQFKNIPLLAATVLTMACSADISELQPTQTTSTPISFAANQQETATVTRADAPLETVSTNFVAYGFKNDGPDGDFYSTYDIVMDGYRVRWVNGTAATTTTNSRDWEYILPSYPAQSVKYWDYSARAYRFFGTTADVPESNITATECRISFTVDTRKDIDKVPYYSHLWFSTGNPDDYPDKQFGQPVTLEFVKAMSQVRFMFVSADPNVDIASLELVNYVFKPVNGTKHITTVGKFIISYPLTTEPEVAESWTVEPATFILALTKPWATEADWTYVLPAKDQGAYMLSVRVNGETKTCTVPAEFMNWLPGYKYTYIFKVDSDLGVTLGQVNSAYTNWQTGKDADYTIYNW